MRIIALFGPTGVGKTAVAVALAALLRARGEDPVAVSADALQVYAGLETLTGVASAAEQRRSWSTGWSRSCRWTRRSAPAEYAQLAHARDRRPAGGGPPADRGGRHGPVPARGARPSSTCARRRRAGVRERWTGGARAPRGAGAARAAARPRAPWAAASDRPQRPPARRAGAGAARAGRARVPARAGRSQLWSEELRHPTLLVGLTMEREALYAAIDARVEAMLAAGVREEVQRAHAAGASQTARKALGFEDLLDGRRRGDEAAHPQLRQAPADVDAQAGGRARDRRRRGATPRSRRARRSRYADAVDGGPALSRPPAAGRPDPAARTSATQ